MDKQEMDIQEVNQELFCILLWIKERGKGVGTILVLISLSRL